MTAHPLSYENLIAIATGQAPADVMTVGEEHLATCVSCRETVDRARMVGAAIRTNATATPSVEAKARVLNLIGSRVPKTTPDGVSRWRRVAATLVFDSRQQPAMAGLRGEADGYLLSYAQGDTSLDLDVMPSANALIWHITGQIGAPGNPAALPISIVGGLGTVVTSVTDEFGVFSLAVAPGQYDLMVDLTKTTIVFPEVSVGEHPNV